MKCLQLQRGAGGIQVPDPQNVETYEYQTFLSPVFFLGLIVYSVLIIFTIANSKKGPAIANSASYSMDSCPLAIYLLLFPTPKFIVDNFAL